MITMKQIKGLSSARPDDLYREMSGCFSSLQNLNCSNASLEVGVLFYLSYKAENDKLLEYIIQSVKKYGNSQDRTIFATVVTELATQMKLSLSESRDLSDCIIKMIGTIHSAMG